MGWDIASNKNKSASSGDSTFEKLGFHLLGSYLCVMVAIWLISDLFVYHSFARNLYQQLDQRLINLADAAAHSLEEIEQNPDLTANYSPKRPLDNDHDLDLHWKTLQRPDQSIEWFNGKNQRIGLSGNLNLDIPLTEGFQFLKSHQLRSLTLAIYQTQGEDKKIVGYVRVSASTEELNNVLTQLRLQSLLGGCVALILMAISGRWLTRKALKPIKTSFQQLQQFTADASHELRNPLAVIQTTVAVMQSHPERILPQDQEKFKGMASATKQMTHLVEDLLLLTRYDHLSAKKPKQGEIIPLKELLEDVIEQHEFLAEKKEIDLTLQGTDNPYIKGDTHQLIRLFANLVENALQYTPYEGKVSVSWETWDYKVVVSVKDTGIGIASDQLPFIFDRFWRADPARSYREEGSGLGLAIVKAIAQQHGGEVKVNSQLEKGSCFLVFLPLAKI